MSISCTPAFDQFREAYDAGKPQVVWSQLVADLETPVSAMMKLAGNEPNSFLLESVTGGAIRGRYSFIGLRPDLIWRCSGNLAEINRNALEDADTFAPCPVSGASGTLDSLRAVLAESRIDLPDDMPPMAAGLVGYMGYDTVRLVESIPDDNPDTLGVPDGLFVRPTIMAVFDNIKDTITVITPLWGGDNAVDAETAYRNAVSRLSDAVDALNGNIEGQVHNTDGIVPELPEPTSNIGQAGYHAMVEKAKEYILAGDIFQVVPSQRF